MGGAPVERGHRRVAVMPSGDLGVPEPMHRSRERQPHQQGGGEHPHTERESVERGGVDGQQRGGGGDDPGAHNRRVPIRSEIAKQIAGMFELAEQPSGGRLPLRCGRRQSGGLAEAVAGARLSIWLSLQDHWTRSRFSSALMRVQTGPPEKASPESGRGPVGESLPGYGSHEPHTSWPGALAATPVGT